ncbi:MAG: adenylyltransferase/cytidyltransferase family protein [Patescibacteria group bacterium]|nr:adenylyltransferase/cytidyltransferase family protein [Patescibacteria group bacterium]
MNKAIDKKIVVAVSGYFNPLHTGHLKLFEDAKKLGDYLVVIINNDRQVGLKGRVPFMVEKDRAEIVSAIKWVDKAFISIDKDRSVCESLKAINPDIFANGGDRNEGNVPEVAVCEKLNIKMIDNVGGDKLNSSSILIKKASELSAEKF